MAFPYVRDELICSVCQEVFIEPVTLICGHSFCLLCINKTWDSQWYRENEISCPECRERFCRRPELRRNVRMCNIAKRFSTSESQLETHILCTYCVQSDVPAAKSCLHCEASLCHTHLIVHSESEEHILTEPSTSFANRKCSLHKKPLEYYCSEEASCLCTSCWVVGQHRGHKVELLTEASEKKKQELKHVQAKLEKLLEKMMSESQASVTRAHLWRRRVHGTQDQLLLQAELVAKKMKTQEPGEWTENMNSLVEKIKDKISTQTGHVLLQAYKPIQQLEILKYELFKAIHHIKHLCNTADPVTILQDRESDGYLRSGFPDVGDVTQSVIEATVEKASDLLESNGNKMRDLCESILEGNLTYHEAETLLFNVIATNRDVDLPLIMQSDLKSGTDQDSETSSLGIEGTGPLPIVAPPVAAESKEQKYLRSVAVSLKPQVIIAPLYAQDVREMFLDVNTAGVELAISEDKKTASILGKGQREIKTPDRFRCKQVLTTVTFSSGRHYWEVETSESGSWRIGIAYPSIARGGDQSQLGNNNKSWGLCRKFNRYSVAHGKRLSLLQHDHSCLRFGILLDYEAGHLSFYELSDPIRHLHTLTASFTEPLHAAFLLNKRSWIRIIT